MTKKDYELIAEGIQLHRKAYGNRTYSIVKETVYHLGLALGLANDNFIYDRFYQACMGNFCIDCAEPIDNAKNCISCRDKRCLNCCKNR